MFPFESLHENASARLWQEILLLPDQLLNNSAGDSGRTNVTKDRNPSFGALQDLQEDSAENLSPNSAWTTQNNRGESSYIR